MKKLRIGLIIGLISGAIGFLTPAVAQYNTFSTDFNYGGYTNVYQGTPQYSKQNPRQDRFQSQTTTQPRGRSGRTARSGRTQSRGATTGQRGQRQSTTRQTRGRSAQTAPARSGRSAQSKQSTRGRAASKTSKRTRSSTAQSRGRSGRSGQTATRTPTRATAGQRSQGTRSSTARSGRSSNATARSGRTSTAVRGTRTPTTRQSRGRSGRPTSTTNTSTARSGRATTARRSSTRQSTSRQSRGRSGRSGQPATAGTQYNTGRSGSTVITPTAETATTTTTSSTGTSLVTVPTSTPALTTEQQAASTAMAYKNIMDGQSCKEAYIKCLDEICVDTVSDKVGRCLCAPNFPRYALKEDKANDIIQRLMQFVDRIKLASEVGTENSQLSGFGEEQQKEMFGNLFTEAEMDLESVMNDTGIDYGDLEVADVKRKEGAALYKDAREACQYFANACPTVAPLIEKGYKAAVDKSCRSYERSLDTAIRNGNNKLQLLSNKFQKIQKSEFLALNKYDATECLVEFRNCMRSEDVCGMDYENCSTLSALQANRAMCAGILNECQTANKGDAVWKQFLAIDHPQYSTTRRRSTPTNNQSIGSRTARKIAPKKISLAEEEAPKTLSQIQKIDPQPSVYQEPKPLIAPRPSTFRAVESKKQSMEIAN